MPLNLFKFFTPAYLFENQPGIALSTVYFLLAVFGLLLIAAITAKILAGKQTENFSKKLLSKYAWLLAVSGLVGYLLIWFRYERVIILSYRFWLPVWLLTVAFWLYNLLRYQLKTVPAAKKRLDQQQVFNKYLPKKKK